MKSIFFKECPCCGTKLNIFNYHIKTRVLPCIEDSNSKSLKCLECKNQITHKVKVSFFYFKAIMLLFSSFIFSNIIINYIDALKNIDNIIINIPFIVLFYLLIYIYDFSTVKLVCKNSENDKEVEPIILSFGDISTSNIHSIFGEGDRKFANKILSYISKLFIFLLISSILIVLLTYIN